MSGRGGDIKVTGAEVALEQEAVSPVWVVMAAVPLTHPSLGS